MVTDNPIDGEVTGWVGFDLDSTLALNLEWRGPLAIGPPILSMVAKLQAYVALGREVRIFTARVCGKYSSSALVRAQAAQIERAIKAWCLQNLGYELEVTCSKDWDMDYVYDDRAREVIPNKGVTLFESLSSFANNIKKEQDTRNSK